ncbi:hypothetical protein EW146_g438 [Bondarzewia mesenterica]|uniref:Uncharacterized protein n=1 Tax=Bondarzewia mesenterica TaxID=1095465 RepID=A0A4S4M8F9_9AGAM|nr:hypothetical protein EW146_g438 [Bondarzewia mesenterica]
MFGQGPVGEQNQRPQALDVLVERVHWRLNVNEEDRELFDRETPKIVYGAGTIHDKGNAAAHDATQGYATRRQPGGLEYKDVDLQGRSRDATRVDTQDLQVHVFLGAGQGAARSTHRSTGPPYPVSELCRVDVLSAAWERRVWTCLDPLSISVPFVRSVTHTLFFLLSFLRSHRHQTLTASALSWPAGLATCAKVIWRELADKHVYELDIWWNTVGVSYIPPSAPDSDPTPQALTLKLLEGDPDQPRKSAAFTVDIMRRRVKDKT